MVNIGQLTTNYCLTRFNAEYYTKKEVYNRHFVRVLEKAEKMPNGRSCQDIFEYLDPKVSIRSNPCLIGKDPLFQDEKEILEMESFLEAGINDVMGLGSSVRGKTVFIKPNLNFIPGGINPYAMTDPRLLLALTHLLHRHGAQVLVGEKPGQKRKSAGSYDLLREHFDIPEYVNFVEIDSEPRSTVETKTKLVSHALDLPRSYLHADYIIDMPKMKTHTLTGVSLGMKNLFGLLTDEEKLKHHNEDIHLKLVDLLSVRTPELTIIDGLISLEGQGPLYGTPRNSNLLIIGDDCVSADAVASYLMTFSPEEIPCIRYAHKMGLGNANLDNIRFPARLPYQLREEFRKGSPTINPFKQIEFMMGKDIPLGYLNAISHSLERLRHEGRKPRKTRIYIGRFNEELNLEENDIVFGDITSVSFGQKPMRIIAGHPPEAFELYQLLK